MGIELINRTAKRYYEETYLQNTGKQFYNIFDTPDDDEAAAFSLDSLIQDPYAATYRQGNGQAHVRPYAPGTGMVLIPPTIGEKTPITSDLRDKIIAGIEPAGGFTRHSAKLIGDILKQHTAAINMQKNYQAMQVLVGGTFLAPGPGGVDIGLTLDFGRSTDQTLTYNFTTGTMSGALKEAQDALLAKGTPMDNLCVIMGSTWLNDFSADTDIIAWRAANTANEILVQDMVPEWVNGIEGLYRVATYRAPDMIAPMHILSYSPPKQYVKDKGETAEVYIAATKAVFFSLSDERYKVNRGIDILDANGKIQRVVGDMVMDSYTENDPVAMYQRTQTRHAFVYGNINHTAVSTGTFV
jgi:hypothetical protein